MVCCLHSEMKAMLRFQLEVSGNKHVIFPSKFMTRPQEVLLYKFSLGHLLKTLTAKVKMLTANDSQISVSNPELTCNLQSWIIQLFPLYIYLEGSTGPVLQSPTWPFMLPFVRHDQNLALSLLLTLIFNSATKSFPFYFPNSLLICVCFSSIAWLGYCGDLLASLHFYSSP